MLMGDGVAKNLMGGGGRGRRLVALIPAKRIAVPGTPRDPELVPLQMLLDSTCHHTIWLVLETPGSPSLLSLTVLVLTLFFLGFAFHLTDAVYVQLHPRPCMHLGSIWKWQCCEFPPLCHLVQLVLYFDVIELCLSLLHRIGRCGAGSTQCNNVRTLGKLCYAL